MPFTAGQFFDVFARYNAAIWPLQIAAYALGVAIVAMLWRGRASRAVAFALALLWAFTGLGYFFVFFAPINPAAGAFGALFALQSALLAHAGRRAPPMAATRAPQRVWGWALIAYALIVYPLVGAGLGHVYPYAPVFGITPCPLVIFTLGVLLVERRLPRRLFAIPIVWSAIGGSAAWLLGVPEDFGLLAAGAVALVVLWSERRRARERRAVAQWQP